VVVSGCGIDKDIAMIALRDAAEKPTVKTKGNITGNKMSHPNTVNFTECLETPFRVQNFEGNFEKGIIGLYRTIWKLKRYIMAAKKGEHRL